MNDFKHLSVDQFLNASHRPLLDVRLFLHRCRLFQSHGLHNRAAGDAVCPHIPQPLQTSLPVMTTAVPSATPTTNIPSAVLPAPPPTCASRTSSTVASEKKLPTSPHLTTTLRGSLGKLPLLVLSVLGSQLALSLQLSHGTTHLHRLGLSHSAVGLCWVCGPLLVLLLHPFHLHFLAHDPTLFSRIELFVLPLITASALFLLAFSSTSTSAAIALALANFSTLQQVGTLRAHVHNKSQHAILGSASALAKMLAFGLASSVPPARESFAIAAVLHILLTTIPLAFLPMVTSDDMNRRRRTSGMKRCVLIALTAAYTAIALAILHGPALVGRVGGPPGREGSTARVRFDRAAGRADMYIAIGAGLAMCGCWVAGWIGEHGVWVWRVGLVCGILTTVPMAIGANVTWASGMFLIGTGPVLAVVLTIPWGEGCGGESGRGLALAQPTALMVAGAFGPVLSAAGSRALRVDALAVGGFAVAAGLVMTEEEEGGEVEDGSESSEAEVKRGMDCC